MERSERIRQQERIVQVVAATLIGGVAVLGGLAYFLSQAGRWSPMDPATGRIVLYAGMGVMAIGLLGAPVLGARLRDSLSRLSEDEVVQRYAASIIVPQAIREGVGMVGVITGLMAGSPIWILIFAAASVGSQAMAFPRSGDLESQLKRRPPSRT